MRIDKNTKIYLGQTEIVKIKKGNVVIWESEPAVEVDYLYLENTYSGSNTITFTTSTNGSPSSDKYTDRIEYSKDKVNWTTLIFDTSTPQTVTINTGEKLYLRNDSGVFNYYNGPGTDYKTSINASQSCVLGGNVNTLLDYNNADNLSLTGKVGCFYRLFAGQSHLTDVSNLVLPATTLASYCYMSMFSGCTSLTSAPALPATTLATGCYSGMFYGCTSLVTAPALPATTLAQYCYSSMFYGCTALTTAPVLPATTLTTYCYQYMFWGCTSLTTAPALPATTLGSYCYDNMFRECTSLTSAPELPATTLASSCYGGMFLGCTSLTSAPALPATTLVNHCYDSMFYGCTSLTTAPVLPATTLVTSCYYQMFQGCTSLTTAPALPATTIADYCYQYMFRGCTSLTTAPALPATTLKIYCYYSMFNGCTALTTAPALPATTLAQYCYGYMFYGCSSLNKVLTYADDISASDCTTDWLDSVAASGTLYNAGSAVYTTDSPSGIPTGWSEVAAPTTSVYAVPDTFSAKSWQDKNRCNFTLMGRNASGIDITIGEMSELVTIGKNTGSSTVTHTETLTYDGMNYTITINQTANDTDEPDYVCIENTTESGLDVTITSSFSSGNNKPTEGTYTESIEYSLDKENWTLVSLVSGSGSSRTGVTETITVPSLGKVYFRNDTGLFSYYAGVNKYFTVSIFTNRNSNVSGDITTLLNYRNSNVDYLQGCFALLFGSGNCMIRNAQDLTLSSKTSKYCYYKMFYTCSNLITTPTLPATTLANYCYGYMFYGCTALTTAPALPATTLASDCYYYMFSVCTSLTTAPVLLPATTLASYCYQYMFYNCTSLTTAPVLPATTLANSCYNYMFQNCTSLTTAPALPATTLESSCYGYMFNGCTSLTTAPELPATTLENSCYQSMFNGCTSLTTAPALPATTLETNCYGSMFSGCTSLTIAPALPATTLVTSCYINMFKNCSNLNSVTSYATTNVTTSCLSSWLQNVSSTGTFNNCGFATYPSGNSGIPTGWTEVYPIQSITANPDTFTLKSYQTKVRCESTLTITTTFGTTVTKTNLVVLTVGENTGDSTRTLTETIPYKGSSYQVTIVQTANDPAPAWSWNVTTPASGYTFELNLNDYYESNNKGVNSSYAYCTLNYSGFDNLILECINYGENKYDYGIISQPDVLLSESTTDDSSGASGTATVFKNFKTESSATPVQLTIPSDGGSHFITIKYKKDGSTAAGNDSLQFRVVEPNT